jgi:phosphatidylserine/phosphatidylglycerophosphate/cardiolipin synthase-like enzyme
MRAADVHGRLRVLQPRLPDDGKLCVHSKVAVIDDRLLRIGSANTSNRSMGFDSE